MLMIIFTLISVETDLPAQVIVVLGLREDGVVQNEDSPDGGHVEGLRPVPTDQRGHVALVHTQHAEYLHQHQVWQQVPQGVLCNTAQREVTSDSRCRENLYYKIF